MEYRCLHKEPLPQTKGEITNFDNSFDKEVIEELSTADKMANYYGWNFHGYVYLAQEGLYVADIHCYKSHAGFIEAHSIPEIITKVSEEYGWD